MTTFFPVSSVLASLRSGIVREKGSVRGSLRTLPLVEGIKIVTEHNPNNPVMGECIALVRSVAVRFATRTAENKGIIHADLLADMVQSVWAKFVDYSVSGRHPVSGWDSFGKYLATFAAGVCMNVNRSEAKQNPNRVLGGRTTSAPGIGGEAWAAYLVANPAPLFKGDAAALPIDRIKQNRSATVWDNASLTDALIDSERNPNRGSEPTEHCANTLTERERDVVRFIRDGKTHAQIGYILGCTRQNVEYLIGKIDTKRKANVGV